VVGLMSVLVWQGRINVGTYLARTDLCRDLFVEVGLVSGLVRRRRVVVGRARRGLLSAGT